MKIEWTPHTDLGMGGLFASPEAYDAEPGISALLVDLCPSKVTAERLGVAACLAFGRYASGSLALPEPVAPEVAQAIEDYCQSWVAVGPIRLEPTALPPGTAAFILGGAPRGRMSNRWGLPRRIALDIRRSDQYSGKLVAVDELVVVSNAWLHARSNEESDIGYYLGDLAVAALFAEALQVDTIAVPSDVDTKTDEFRRVQALLSSARLGLAPAEALATLS